MTTKSPQFHILDGPSSGDLSVAHYWRKQEIVYLPLTVSLVLPGEKIPEHRAIPSFKLLISIECSGWNGNEDYMISGLARGLPIVAEDLGEDILRLKRAYEEFGPFYRAFFSTKGRGGRLGFSKRPLIPYHHPIFDDPVDVAQDLIREMLESTTLSPYVESRLRIMQQRLMSDYELAGREPVE